MLLLDSIILYRPRFNEQRILCPRITKGQWRKNILFVHLKGSSSVKGYLSGVSPKFLESSQLKLLTEHGVDVVLAEDALKLRLAPKSKGTYPDSLK